MNAVIGRFNSAQSIDYTISELQKRGYYFSEREAWGGVDEANILWNELREDAILTIENDTLYTADSKTFNVDETQNMIRQHYIFTTPDDLFEVLDKENK